jgi:gamma-glutamylcyclotransferase (GGCT)/AIG2-like uncharacterized protein YtfP
MALLFSYGTLQQEDVQLATFGRRLDGEREELPRFEPSRVGPHANALFNGREESRVAGTVFEITDAELAAADRFEAPFSYKRVSAVLTSGRQAWLYVHAVD